MELLSDLTEPKPLLTPAIGFSEIKTNSMAVLLFLLA